MDLNKPIKLPDVLVGAAADYHGVFTRAVAEVNILQQSIQAQEALLNEAKVNLTAKLVANNVIDANTAYNIDARYADELHVAYIWVHDPDRVPRARGEKLH